MKFMGGCFSKVLLVIFCILLGVVLTLGGIAGAGYFALMTDGMMGKVADKANESGAVTLDFSDEVRGMSVYNWAKGAIGLVSTLSQDNGPTIGEFEKYIGLDIISSTLADFTKIDQDVIKNASLVGDETGIAAVITTELTMNKVMEMVGENIMPDMPLFKEDSEFMNAPIKDAFKGLTDYAIGDFIKVDENSQKIMQTLAKLKISEISEKVPTLPIGDFIDQGPDAHPVIAVLSPLTISDLGTSKLTDAINGMKLSEILTGMTETETNKVLYSLKDLTVGELSGSQANTRINSMFLGEIMDIDSSSNQALQSLKYSCIASQYVEITPSSTHEGYGYTAGGRYNVVQANTNGSYYVAFYPETIEYTVAKDSSEVALYRNGNYGVKYEIYRPTSSLTNGTVEIDGVTFTAVKDEHNVVVTDGDKTLVSAVLYVSPLDGKISEDSSSFTIKNRYHYLYNESGEIAFRNASDDATLKGVLLIPASSVHSVDGSVLVADNAYKQVGTKYLDNKAAAEDDKVTIGEAQYTVYTMRPLEGINETMNDLTLGDVMTIDASSPRIMQSLKDTKITEMGSTIDNMPLGDIVDVGDSRILHSLAGTPLNKMSETIDSMFVDELMEIGEDSSRMLKSLRYAALKSQTEYIAVSTLVASADLAATVTNKDDYLARETDYYSAYRKVDGTTENRYYYKVADNAITDVYVLYLNDNDEVKTEDANTCFYKVKTYPSDVEIYVDLTDAALKRKAGIDLTVEGNEEIVNAEKDGKNYYYVTDASGKITDTYVQSGTPVLDGEGKTLVVHSVDFSRPQMGMSDKTNELVLADVLEITPSSSKILRNLSGTKVNKLGERIDTMTLGEMVNTDSSKLLSSLSDATLNGLGDKVNTLFLDEMINIDSGSSNMIRSLRYATLESQLEYVDMAVLSSSATATATDIAEFRTLEISDYAAYVKKNATVENRYYYVIGVDNTVETVYVLYYDKDENVKVDGDGNTAFYKVKRYEQKAYDYLEIASLVDSENVNSSVGSNATVLAAEESGKTYLYRVDGAEEITVVYEYYDDDRESLVELDAGRNPVKTYYAVKNDGAYVTDPADSDKIKVYTVEEVYNRPMIGLSDKTEELVLGDVFSEENLRSGVLSLIDKNTKLNDISNAVATAVQNSSVAVLSDTGVIASSTFAGEDFQKLSKERKAFIYNSTMTNMLDGMIGFIADPLEKIGGTPTGNVNYSKVSPHAINVSATSFASLSDFVAAYAQYDEITFSGGAVTVTVLPADEQTWGVDEDNDGTIDYFAIPVFNVAGANGVTFNGGTVHVAVYSQTGADFTYGTHQVGYFYDATNSISAEARCPKLLKITDPTP